MKIKNILMIFSLTACLTACGSMTTESDSLNEDSAATYKTVSEAIEVTCPFADYTFSPVRATSPAYVPYLLEVEEQTANQLYDAFVNTSWELIPSDTPYPDGETFQIFVYNNGHPFKLVFYGDSTVDYEHENTTERYKVDDISVRKMAYDAANPVNLGDIFDTLIWCEPEFLTYDKVWNDCQPIETESAATYKTVSEAIEVTCPFADYTFSPVRATSPAYVPYLLEVEEQTANQLYDAFVNTSWELIPSDTPYPDGETFQIFVYNNGHPFKLVFYGDSTVDYEHENTTERYKVDDISVRKMAYDTANPVNLGDIFDTLIWCEPEFLTYDKVWNDCQSIETEPES